MMTIYEYFSDDTTLEAFDDLFNYEAMLREHNVDSFIKDMVIPLEKNLIDKINSKSLKIEEFIAMFVSLFAYIIQDIEDGRRSIKVSRETYGILLDIMEIQYPDIPRKAITIGDFENRNKALDKLINQLIEKSPDILEPDALDNTDSDRR